MMLADGVMGLCGCDEVARNQFGALVNELVKGMLAIGARFAPDNRPCLIVYRIAFTVHVLAVALHIALLEIGSKPVQVLVVREDGLCFCVEEVVVPNTE